MPNEQARGDCGETKPLWETLRGTGQWKNTHPALCDTGLCDYVSLQSRIPLSEFVIVAAQICWFGSRRLVWHHHSFSQAFFYSLVWNISTALRVNSNSFQENKNTHKKKIPMDFDQTFRAATIANKLGGILEGRSIKDERVLCFNIHTVHSASQSYRNCNNKKDINLHVYKVRDDPPSLMPKVSLVTACIKSTEKSIARNKTKLFYVKCLNWTLGCFTVMLLLSFQQVIKSTVVSIWSKL